MNKQNRYEQGSQNWAGPPPPRPGGPYGAPWNYPMPWGWGANYAGEQPRTSQSREGSGEKDRAETPDESQRDYPPDWREYSHYWGYGPSQQGWQGAPWYYGQYYPYWWGPQQWNAGYQPSWGWQQSPQGYGYPPYYYGYQHCPQAYGHGQQYHPYGYNQYYQPYGYNQYYHPYAYGQQYYPYSYGYEQPWSWGQSQMSRWGQHAYGMFGPWWAYWSNPYFQYGWGWRRWYPYWEQYCPSPQCEYRPAA